MSHQPNERLLNDVMLEGTGACAREALLDQTLKLVRRQRRVRKARRGALALVVVVVFSLVVWRSAPPSHLPPTASHSYALIQTEPLAISAIVVTPAIGSTKIVTATEHVETVVTVRTGAVRELNDDQLLELAAPRAALLVRRGPLDAELVFANPADREGLLRN